jgi:hypothetical protein
MLGDLVPLGSQDLINYRFIQHQTPSGCDVRNYGYDLGGCINHLEHFMPTPRALFL